MGDAPLLRLVSCWVSGLLWLNQQETKLSPNRPQENVRIYHCRRHCKLLDIPPGKPSVFRMRFLGYITLAPLSSIASADRAKPFRLRMILQSPFPMGAGAVGITKERAATGHRHPFSVWRISDRYHMHLHQFTREMSASHPQSISCS